jgi:hypothetical protein
VYLVFGIKDSGKLKKIINKDGVKKRSKKDGYGK